MATQSSGCRELLCSDSVERSGYGGCMGARCPVKITRCFRFVEDIPVVSNGPTVPADKAPRGSDIEDSECGEQAPCCRALQG